MIEQSRIESQSENINENDYDLHLNLKRQGIAITLFALDDNSMVKNKFAIDISKDSMDPQLKELYKNKLKQLYRTLQYKKNLVVDTHRGVIKIQLFQRQGQSRLLRKEIPITLERKEFNRFDMNLETLRIKMERQMAAKQQQIEKNYENKLRELQNKMRDQRFEVRKISRIMTLLFVMLISFCLFLYFEPRMTSSIPINDTQTGSIQPINKNETIYQTQPTITCGQNQEIINEENEEIPPSIPYPSSGNSGHKKFGIEEKLNKKIAKLEKSLKILTPFDLLATDMSKFSFMGDSLKYKGVTGIRTQALLNEAILPNQTKTISLSIKKSSSGSLAVGIIDQSQIQKRSALAHKHTITYVGRQGAIRMGGTISNNEGSVFKEGDQITMKVNRKTGQMQWLINGSLQAQIKSDILLLQQIIFVVSIDMAEKGETVQVLMDPENS